ncbi:GNAT family N-acetyltransferase [Pediococcus pentosaceus]|uniref:GNAT family N-acetyltransferase n=1 Tax=Pediococcus pentosaceus TaxID=1255 RepID=UPI00070503A3|nr:GNAT family N-acetyltransferase [Pediococcus pentosaceus]MCT3022043.1 N-acetyltransferase [Pediococcus pentosaceus]MDG9753606.1 GNAT family N-acetyltransferase [Pediococcus pentosaceus]QQC02760.1 N-acetyltransferase [Pediococcus pentosaceus]GEP17765.1 phosphinothricin acetyltransferase [Pediococcus pentosaceus]
MTVEFEIALKEDLPEIVKIYNETIDSRMATADTKYVTVEERQEWFQAHQEPTRPLWVIKVRGVIAGWISFSSFYGRPAYLHTVEISIYIDQSFRGMHLGRKAIKFAEEQAPKLEINRIMAFIFAHNLPSIGLFKSENYEKWGTLPQIAEMDGQLDDLTIMGKHLK